MDSEGIKERIRENAAEIVRLHSRIHETYSQRAESAENDVSGKKRVQSFMHDMTVSHFPLVIREAVH